MFKSFAAAVNGILIALKTERNVQIHGIIAILVFWVGKWLQLIRFEMAIIWICFAMVMGAELLNTSIEKLCDKVEAKVDPQIKTVKDIAAGAVLFISICAAVIGLYILLPKLLNKI